MDNHISDEDDVEEEFTSLIQISSLSQHTISDPDVIHRLDPVGEGGKSNLSPLYHSRDVPGEENARKWFVLRENSAESTLSEYHSTSRTISDDITQYPIIDDEPPQPTLNSIPSIPQELNSFDSFQNSQVTWRASQIISSTVLHGQGTNNFSQHSLSSRTVSDDVEYSEQSLQQYPVDDQLTTDALSEYYLSATSLPSGRTSRSSDPSGGSSRSSPDDIAMFTTRPGTVLETMKLVNTDNGATMEHQTQPPAVNNGVDAVLPMEYLTATTFTELTEGGNGHKFSEDTIRMSIGDSIVHTMKQPISSSTPASNRSSGSTLFGSGEDSAHSSNSGTGLPSQEQDILIKVGDDNAVDDYETDPTGVESDSGNQTDTVSGDEKKGVLRHSHIDGYMGPLERQKLMGADAVSGSENMNDHINITNEGDMIQSKEDFSTENSAQANVRFGKASPQVGHNDSDISEVDGVSGRKTGSPGSQTETSVWSATESTDDEHRLMVRKMLLDDQQVIGNKSQQHESNEKYPSILEQNGGSEGDIEISQPEEEVSADVRESVTDPDVEAILQKMTNHKINGGLMSLKLSALDEASKLVTTNEEDDNLGSHNSSLVPPQAYFGLRNDSFSDTEDLVRISNEYKTILKGTDKTTNFDSDTAGETDTSAGQNALIRMALKNSSQDQEFYSKKEMDLSPSSQLSVSSLSTDYHTLPKRISSTNSSFLKESALEERASSAADSTCTQDTLDQDVRRILSKYGKSLSDGEEQSTGRDSPADSDKTSMTDKVTLLLRGGNDVASMSARTDGSFPTYLYDDPARSMTLPVDSETASVDTPRSSFNKSKESILDKSKGSIHKSGLEDFNKSEQMPNYKEFLVADENHVHFSKDSSKRSSVASSIDFDNLEKDLNDIQMGLANLKTDEKSREGGKEDAIQTSSGSGHDYYRRPRDVADISTAVEGRNDHGKTHKKSAFTGVNPLLTSGVIPMDLALEIVHDMEKYSYTSADITQNISTASIEDTRNRSTNIVQQRKSPSPTSLVSGKISSEPSDDRRTLSERVFDILTQDSPSKQAQIYLKETSENSDTLTQRQEQTKPPHIPSSVHREEKQETRKSTHLAGVDKYASQSQSTESGGIKPGNNFTDIMPTSTLTKTPVRYSSPNYSFEMTPVTKEPFSAFGTASNFVSSQLDKLSNINFDQSMDVTSPYKRLPERTSSSGTMSTVRGSQDNQPPHPMNKSIPELRSSQIHDVHGSVTTTRSMSPIDSNIHVTSRSRMDRPDESSHRAVSGESINDKVLTNTSAGQKNISGRPKSASPLGNLRPYRPAGTQDVYYVESTTDDAMSETTVESTHPGSDDARGPMFPSSTLGSRPDMKKDSGGIYHKQHSPSEAALLGTIQELPSFSEGKSVGSNSQKSKDTDDEKKQVISDKDRSLRKTEEWIHGNFVGEKNTTEHDRVSAPQTAEVSDEKEHNPRQKTAPKYEISHRIEGIATDFGTPPKPSCTKKTEEGMQNKSGEDESHQKIPSKREHLDQMVDRIHRDFTADYQRKLRGVQEQQGRHVFTSDSDRTGLSGLDASLGESELRYHSELIPVSSVNLPRHSPLLRHSPIYTDNATYDTTSKAPATSYTSPKEVISSDKFKPLIPDVEDDDKPGHIYRRTPHPERNRFESSAYLSKDDYNHRSASSHDPTLYSSPEALSYHTEITESSPDRSPLSHGLQSTTDWSKSDLTQSPQYTTTVSNSSLRKSPTRSISPSSTRHLSPSSQPERILDPDPRLIQRTSPRDPRLVSPRASPKTSPRVSRKERTSRSEKYKKSDMYGRELPSNLHELWEKFQATWSGSSANTSNSSLDSAKLVSLLKNPVQHYVQEGYGASDGKLKSSKATLRRVLNGDQITGHTRSDNYSTNPRVDDNRVHFANMSDSSYEDRVQKDTNERKSERSNRKQAGDRQSEKETSQSRPDNIQWPMELQRVNDRLSKQDNHSTAGNVPSHTSNQNQRQEIGSLSTNHTGEVNRVASKKRAWIVEDEELHSIPEDSTLDSITSDYTTSSSIESDGKLILRTTKRHLPDDPKLLRLQQKIAKQKEKHKHEYVREKRRRDKISQLEHMLKQKGLVLDSSSSTLSTMADSDSTLGLSDINSTLTASSTFMSGDSISHDFESRSNQAGCSCHQSKKQRSTSTPSNKSHKQTEKIKLQPVDYNHKDLSQHRATYMEFDKPSLKNSTKKRISSNKSTPSKVTKDSANKANKARKSKSDSSPKQHRIKSSTNDFGATCPTPLLTSPTILNRNGKEMVSEAVQTTPKMTSNFDGTAGVKHNSDTRKSGRDISKNLYQQMIKKPSKPGVAWFFPMEGSPTRKPLKERQINIPEKMGGSEKSHHRRQISNGSYLDDEENSSFLSTVNNTVNSQASLLHLSDMEKSGVKMSLQDAFQLYRQDLISKSREREKHIALRAEERRMQELHQMERQQLFQLKKNQKANRDAHPICEQHFKPTRRKINKTEMREQSARKYKNLPEVVQEAENKRRLELNKTNRLRAQLYKQRISNHVLRKRGLLLDV